MSPLGVNPIRAPGLTDFREPLSSGLVLPPSSHLLVRGPGTPNPGSTPRAWILGQLRGKQDPHAPLSA